MKAEEKNHSAGKRGEEALVADQEFADGAGGSSEGDEDHGETQDKSERRAEQAAARLLALTKLVHANAAQHGDVSGDERQDTRGEKGDESGDERGEYGDFHWSVVLLESQRQRRIGCPEHAPRFGAKEYFRMGRGERRNCKFQMKRKRKNRKKNKKKKIQRREHRENRDRREDRGNRGHREEREGGWRKWAG